LLWYQYWLLDDSEMMQSGWCKVSFVRELLQGSHYYVLQQYVVPGSTLNFVALLCSLLSINGINRPFSRRSAICFPHFEFPLSFLISKSFRTYTSSGTHFFILHSPFTGTLLPQASSCILLSLCSLVSRP
jgi:hypothetical protein